MEFIVQFSNGDFLTDKPRATHFASFARKLTLAWALHFANQVPGSRVIAMLSAGSYTAEDLRDSEQFMGACE